MVNTEILPGMEYAIRYAGARHWSELPKEMKESASPSDFIAGGRGRGKVCARRLLCGAWKLDGNADIEQCGNLLLGKISIVSKPESNLLPLSLLLTQRFLAFRCVRCMKIKDTDDLLPVKDGRYSRDGNYTFEICHLPAFLAPKSLSEK